jgi:phenylalanyl-tRNA synthetase beta chain
LILEICPDAIFEDIVDVEPKTEKLREPISLDVSYINKKLGSNISISEVEKILNNFGFKCEIFGDKFGVLPPALRLDLVRPEDIVEEIGRVIGYDRITPTIPKINFTANVNEQYSQICATRAKLLNDGYSEVMNYSFAKKGKVEVARGAKGKEFLRTNLSDGLKVSYELNRLNAPLIGNDETKIFEIGTVFSEVGREEMHIAYADKKGVVESTLEEFSRDLHLETGFPSNDLRLTASDKKFVAWSQYPFITRDVAVWVPAGVTGDELIKLCKENGTELLNKEPRLFDEFTKGDKTSLAVRLVFQSGERTLLDSEVTEIMHKITKEIGDRGWEIR